MEKFIISTSINVVAMFFLAWTFSLVEKNEDLDTDIKLKRNDQWHRTKSLAVGFLFANISYHYLGFNWSALIHWIGCLSLVPIVFNPAINSFKGNGFFYLSSDKSTFEHLFANKLWKRVLYYLCFVLIFIASTLLIISKIKLS